MTTPTTEIPGVGPPSAQRDTTRTEPEATVSPFRINRAQQVPFPRSPATSTAGTTHWAVFPPLVSEAAGENATGASGAEAVANSSTGVAGHAASAPAASRKVSASALSSPNLSTPSRSAGLRPS